MNKKQTKARDDKLKRLNEVDEIANKTKKELLNAENGKRKKINLSRALYAKSLLRKIEQDKNEFEPIVNLFNQLMQLTGSKTSSEVVNRFVNREVLYYYY